MDAISSEISSCAAAYGLAEEAVDVPAMVPPVASSAMPAWRGWFFGASSSGAGVIVGAVSISMSVSAGCGLSVIRSLLFGFILPRSAVDMPAGALILLIYTVLLKYHILLLPFAVIAADIVSWRNSFFSDGIVTDA